MVDCLSGFPSISSSLMEYERVSRYEYPYKASSNFRTLSPYSHAKICRAGLEERDQEALLMKLNELKSEIRKIFCVWSSRDHDVKSYILDKDRLDRPSRRHLLPSMRPSRRNVADPHVSLSSRFLTAALKNRSNSTFYDHTDRTEVRMHGRFASEITSKPCLPIGNGAPFLICGNCSNLLKLPRKLRMKQTVKQKISCGVCSVIISVEVENGRLLAFLLKDQSPSSPECHDPSDHNSLCLRPDHKTLIEKKSSSRTEFKESMSPPSSVSLQEQVNYSSFDTIENRATHPITRQNVLRDTLVPSGNEIEISFNVYLKRDTNLSPGSVNTTEEGNRGKASKPGRSEPSFFRSLIKNSFREFSAENHSPDERQKISVNGHCIQTRVVKEASVLAGPILPGDYWYDVQAGFWGVMGQPCLGIILPFIKQFDYPMSMDCSNGNTGIFVNGRELHWKDLDLLESRGLPTVRNKSYRVESSGRVINEESGEEICILQKLAPNVERKNRGFGMLVPRCSPDDEGLVFSFRGT